MANYTIKKGDTLGALAKRYGISVNELAKMNGIKNVNRIYAGANLKVPDRNNNPAPNPTPAQPSAPAPQTPTPPQPPSIDQWLAGDSMYQSQLANYQKARNDYDTQYNRQIQDKEREYGQTTRQMGTQAEVDRGQQMNDFAGRGVLNSGVYAKALSDYNTDYNTRLQNLLQGKTDTVNNLSDARTNYLRTLQAEEDTAKQDAIRRRAQQFGV